MFALAFGTDSGLSLCVVAVVAEQPPVAPVIRQSHCAVAALNPFAAGAARDEGGKTTAVQEYHDLLAALEPLADRFHQPPRKRVLLSCVEKFFAHIDQFHLRQRSLFNALRQLDKRVLAAIRVVPAFEAWRGGTQHHAGAC